MTYHMVHHVQQQPRAFILPQQSAEEAGLVNDAIVYPAKTLLAVCAHLNGHALLTPYQSNATPQPIVYPDEWATWYRKKHVGFTVCWYLACDD